MITKFLKNLLNNKGSSLVQVMVISGMVSVFGLGVMQTQKNVKSVQTTLLTREANDELRKAIISLLKYPESCQLNLSYFSETNANANAGLTSFMTKPGSPATLIDIGSNPVYLADESTTYFGRARIKSFSVGHYVAAKNLATLRVTASNTFGGGLNLGGKEINIDIPVRLYYSGGLLARCMAEESNKMKANGELEIYDNASLGSLSQVCSDRLGGSFWNGECRMPTNVEKLSKSKSGTAAVATDNLCSNLGGNYDPATEQCTQGTMGGSKIFCPSNKKIIGFDNNGSAICEP